ncbi:hypothetical protein [Parvularcula maris]|uniref:Uncharacterized protein n=1 Tax=Parvularcula maris TaxID=2965077 RepID=A0A9X2L6G4_9PROT|nr:hypothetical protein [Parvularcula maris]MCQ8183921.1 hypothetical protein [Parvularcula maris]
MLSLLIAAVALQTAPVDAYRACVDVEDSLERLRCFDAAGREDKGRRQVAAPAPAAKVVAPPPARSAELDQARRAAEAADERARAAEAELARARQQARDASRAAKPSFPYDAVVTELRFGTRGKLTVRLDNGEIWDQLDSDSTTISESRRDRVQRVTIKRAALGGRRMEIEPLGRTIRVRLRD